MRTTEHPRAIVGQRKAEVFNARYTVGDLIAVRRVPGEPATWDRVFAPAYGMGDAAMVELASSLVPVDTDIVFTYDPATHEPDSRAACAGITHCPEGRRRGAWVLACAYLLGFASAVALALVQPVRAADPAEPCAAPAEMTSKAEGEAA